MNRRFLGQIGLFVLLAAVVPPSFGMANDDDLQWKVGLASAKITPDKPVFLAGFGARQRKPSDGVGLDLYVKALALEDLHGQRAVILTMDLLFVDDRLIDPVIRRIGEKAGLQREQVLFNASHTHSAPAVRFDVDPSNQIVRNMVEFTRNVEDKMVEITVRALDDLGPARLHFGKGVAHFAMNRRKFMEDDGVKMAPNPQGPVDRSVPVLRITTPGGRLRGIVFGYACHATALLYDNFKISSDYPGYARAYLEKKYPGVQAMFLQGCGGDVMAFPRGTVEWAQQHGESLGEEVARKVEDRLHPIYGQKLRPVGGPLGVAFDHAQLPISKMSRQELEQIAAGSMRASGKREINPNTQRSARGVLARVKKGEELQTHVSAPVAVWQFGDDLSLVGLAGEVVQDYVYLIERAVGAGGLWIAGYTNGNPGYIPSVRVLEEGGYEAKGTAWGQFAPEVEQAYAGTVREMAIELGREVPPRE